MGWPRMASFSLSRNPMYPAYASDWTNSTRSRWEEILRMALGPLDQGASASAATTAPDRSIKGSATGAPPARPCRPGTGRMTGVTAGTVGAGGTTVTTGTESATAAEQATEAATETTITAPRTATEMTIAGPMTAAGTTTAGPKTATRPAGGRRRARPGSLQR